MAAQCSDTKSASEVKAPLSADSRETILFVIPPAYYNTDSYNQVSLPVKI